MKHGKTLLKIAAFLLLFALVFFSVASLFHSGMNYTPGMMKSVSDAAPGSLDGIVLGSSTVYTYWVPAAAWESRGYAVQSLSVSAMPPQSILPLIRWQRKAQPDALYIINLIMFRERAGKEVVTFENMHYLLDFMPLGETKLELMARLWNKSGVKGLNQAEYILPFLRFHSEWQSITTEDLQWKYQDTKGSYYSNAWVHDVKNITSQYQTVNETAHMGLGTLEVLDELLTYLKEEKVNALFVTVPCCMAEEEHKRMNTVVDTVEAAGFPVFDMLNEAEALDLDTAHDYMDMDHTNIHGAMLYTRALCAYLDAQYGFTDKRDDPSYADWNEASAQYAAKVRKYVVGSEWALQARDNGLAVPKLKAPKAAEKGVTVRWSPVEGAECYTVYFREAGGIWTEGAVLDSGVTQWVDTDVKPGQTRTYTVAAGCKSGEETAWSRYDTDGVSVTVPEP